MKYHNYAACNVLVCCTYSHAHKIDRSQKNDLSWWAVYCRRSTEAARRHFVIHHRSGRLVYCGSPPFPPWQPTVTAVSSTMAVALPRFNCLAPHQLPCLVGCPRASTATTRRTWTVADRYSRILLLSRATAMALASRRVWPVSAAARSTTPRTNFNTHAQQRKVHKNAQAGTPLPAARPPRRSSPRRPPHWPPTRRPTHRSPT